jgi:hypothetical protein
VLEDGGNVGVCHGHHRTGWTLTSAIPGLVRASS